MHYPWRALTNWEPFRLDALGLITLLGAEDIDQWVGRLVPSRWVEYMPLLGIYVIAAGRFQRKAPSFLLYNISQGICTTDCAAWFTRWVQCQNFQATRSIVYWETARKRRNQWVDHLIAASVSSCIMGFLVLMNILSRDIYGLVNTVAIIITIFTRAYILSAHRNSIDRSTPNFAPGNQTEKLIVITPDSKVVTMFIHKSSIIPLFIRNPTPSSTLMYKVSCWINWLAFGVHVVILGMASLPTQIYTVSVIIVSSILICVGFGCADMGRAQPIVTKDGKTRGYICWIGSHLKATVFEWPSGLEFKRLDAHAGTAGRWQLWADYCPRGDPDQLSTRRMDLYAWLDLTVEEEQSLDKWDLLPQKRGEDTSWSDEFKAKQALVKARGLSMWTIKQSVHLALGDGTIMKSRLWAEYQHQGGRPKTVEP